MQDRQLVFNNAGSMNEYLERKDNKTDFENLVKV